jgi:integrase
MKGTRPLTTDEIRAVSKQFDGDFAIRNRSLFMLGVSVGGRISELLALTIGDVWQNNQPVSDLLFER